MASKKKNKKKAKNKSKKREIVPTKDIFLDAFDPSTSTICAEPSAIEHDADGVKIVAIVAETVQFYTSTDITKPTGRYKMECGRNAAQVAHVVSKLKAEYAQLKGLDPIFLANHPITTIVLKARDSQELTHILGLAENANVLVSGFWDDNDKIYGKESPLTAVALGPIYGGQDVDITGYLPLYTCNCQQK